MNVTQLASVVGTSHDERMPRTQTPPSPLDLTRDLLDVSVTERADFRSCRRRWWLTTIENLQPKHTDDLAFDFGTGIHSALEAYYSSKARSHAGRVSTAYVAFAKWVADMKMRVPENDNEAFTNVVEHEHLGQAMLEYYFEYDQMASVQLGKVVAVEGRFIDKNFKTGRPSGYPSSVDPVLHESGRLLVPIVDPDTKQRLITDQADHQSPMLTMRIDLLTERKTPKLGLWIDDHKTSSSSPSDRGIDFDDQVTGYCYGVWRYTGRIPRGVVFNYLIKETPKEPRVVQARGKKDELALSTAKDQLTTPNMYREALKDWGLMSGNRVLSDAHAECLGALLARGWDPFFRRLEVTRNEHELLSFEQHLVEEYFDMLELRDNPSRRYPNRSKWHCPGCPVNKVCLAMEDGSDAEYLIEHQFVQAPDRKA